MTSGKNIPKVLNQRNRELGNNWVYVGRPGLSRQRRGDINHFGNPFSHIPGFTVLVKDRDEAVDRFEEWLDGKHPEVEPERLRWVLDNLHTLRGYDLVCWCAPLRCHAEVLMRRANDH